MTKSWRCPICAPAQISLFAHGRAVWAVEGVEALSQIAGREPGGSNRIPAVSRDAMAAIREPHFALDGPGAGDQTATGALREVLGASRSCSQESAGLQPYAKEIIS